uniref:Uncharacterized protein n=1 Tax=Anopheles atroparvus TaxID=41427 RepID=A0AAG5CYR8_ANOAO
MEPPRRQRAGDADDGEISGAHCGSSTNGQLVK